LITATITSKYKIHKKLTISSSKSSFWDGPK